MSITQQTPVTWLMPIKNGMPYLPRALESIATQTCRDFQVIAWDNASTDGTVEVLRQWIPNRLPGRIVTDRPMPFGSSLAAMVEMARSPLCARMDADDINEPHRLATQLSFLNARPDIAVLSSAIQQIDTHDRPLASTSSIVTDDAVIRWRLRFCNAVNHPAVIFRRKAILDAGNYRDALPAEDYELWMRVALKYRIANLSEPLVRYRIHNSSLCAVHQDRIGEIRSMIRHRHAEAMLPGLTDSARRRLYDRLDHHEIADVTLRDCLAFRRTARLAAVQAGERADYFTSTNLYRTQMRSLVFRRLKALPVVGDAWARLRRHKPSANDGPDVGRQTRREAA